MKITFLLYNPINWPAFPCTHYSYMAFNSFAASSPKAGNKTARQNVPPHVYFFRKIPRCGFTGVWVINLYKVLVAYYQYAIKFLLHTTNMFYQFYFHQLRKCSLNSLTSKVKNSLQKMFLKLLIVYTVLVVT